MKKIASLLVAVVSIMLIVPCFAYSPPPVTDGLVGCWKFDEGSGFTAEDSSGNGNHGLIVNATYSEDIPPKALSNYSLRFNTTQVGYAYSYVTIPDSPSLRPNSSLTLAAWVKTTDVNVVRSCAIVSKQYGSSYHNSFGLWYQYGTLRFALEDGITYAVIFVAQPSANEWHHIVATYNGSLMRLYVDGVEQVNATFTGSIVYDSNPVLIGADSDNANHIPESGWNGTIDEVLIYNRALNQTEITQIMIPDTTAPAVDSLSQNPSKENVQPYQNVTVSLNITDTESGVKNATLYYSLTNGTTWEAPVQMGLNATTNLYEATIPGQEAGTWVKYKIVAYDNAGNNVTLGETEPYLVYQVIPEFPPILILPLFMILTMLAVVFAKKKATKNKA